MLDETLSKYLLSEMLAEILNFEKIAKDFGKCFSKYLASISESVSSSSSART